MLCDHGDGDGDGDEDGVGDGTRPDQEIKVSTLPGACTWHIYLECLPDAHT